MQKFENVDLIDTLRQIMQAHTQYYKQDFKYDIDAIQKAAMSDNAEDRNMLWLSRTHGTHCFFEKDVFIKNTSANVAWKHWFEQKSDNPIAYAFEITYTEHDNIYGNLYQLDYEKNVADIKKNAIKADSQILHYEGGDVLMDFGKWFSADEHKYYGRYIGLDYVPNDAEKLEDVLKAVRRERNDFPVGDIETHIDELIKSAVANRIIGMTDKEKLDHIELIHYRLDYGDTKNITTFDYALYDALIHSKKPSIKKQLSDNTIKDGSVPAKKTRNKNNDLEV